MNLKELVKLVKTFPKMSRGKSLVNQLPDYLKDPRNYEKIQRALLDTLAGQHSHSEVIDWHKCLTCQNKVLNQKEMMVKLGFKTPRHYYAWKKTMDVMIGKTTPTAPIYDYRKDILEK